MCLLKADVNIDVVSFVHFHNKHSTLLKAHKHTHILSFMKMIFLCLHQYNVFFIQTKNKKKMIIEGRQYCSYIQIPFPCLVEKLIFLAQHYRKSEKKLQKSKVDSVQIKALPARGHIAFNFA